MPVCPSNGNLCGNVWIWVVALQLEIFIAEAEEVFDVGVDFHRWQRARRARQLQAGLVEVVELEMGVARGVDEVAWNESANLRCHLQ